MNFRRFIIVAELWRPEVARLGKSCQFCAFFGKRPHAGKFSKFCSESFHRDTDRRIDVLYSNFVKFGLWEVGEIVRYLADIKQNFAWHSSSRYCVDRAQNLPAPATDSVLRLLQI